MVYLETHLKKYSDMEIEDIIKLYFQGIMGPAHLISDYNKALKLIKDELSYADNSDEMIEEISDKYVRVYIKPYYDKYHNLDNLVNAFIKSSFDKNNIDEFINEIKTLKKYDKNNYIEKYLSKSNYIISHSNNYKLKYNPHYRVINKKYLEEVMKSKVYFTKEITSEAVMKLYEKINYKLNGNVCIKVHSGEPGNQNFIRPDFWDTIIKTVNGTVVECNTAYEGKRDTTEKHLKTFKEHGWNRYRVDLLDKEGPDLVLEIPNGEVIKTNYVGKDIINYDSMLVLSHFKGHPMGGYGGALKQLSIGIASAFGKTYIHGAGKPEEIWSAPHDLFLSSMADAAKSVIDFFNGNILYINVMKNMSVDCDCCAVAEDPCMKDIGILISTDPVAIDQACIDLVYNSNDPGKKHLIERIESRNGLLTIEKAIALGCGTKEYELINID